MPERIPQIVNGVVDQADAPSIRVGSSEWLNWVKENEIQSFAFQDSIGKFTARLERKQHGSGYWVAYRKLKGKLHKVYLGKTEELTLEHLSRAAETLLQTKTNARDKSPSIHRSVIQNSLLRTKLYAPPARPDLIPRPHVLERLTLGLQNKLTLVCAPAGFGKTTLLSAWRTTSLGQERSLAWVSLETEDNDSIRFLRYVCTALETIQPECTRTALMLLHSRQHVSLDAVLTELLNGITTLKDDTVLVLDDYHLIDNQSVHQTMTFLLEHLPQQLHLALLSRADPPFPLTRLRSRGELLELRMPELRFTQQEVEVFLLQKGLSLSETDMLTLADRSEGWVGGLQLAAISMRGRQELSGFVNTFAGSHRFIVDYLANEVLERQTPEVRKFLLETSILERLCGSLCDAVTGRGDGQQMLEGLEAANLFVIPLDDERRWYRYHHLFAEFLRTRLEQRRSDTADLHKRAALWLEQHGLLSDAVHHLRASLSYTEVARLVEQQLEWAMEHGQFHTLLQWLESIPETEARLRPRLCVFRALLLAWTGQLHEAESWLAVLEHNLDDLGKHEAESIRAEGSGVRAIIASITGDLTRTIELSEHALQRLSPESLVVRSVLAASLNRVYFLAGYPRKSSEILAEARPLAEAGGLPGFALLLHALEGHAQVALGQLGQAAWRYREVLRSIADSGEPYSAQASVAHLCLGAVLCEWNQLEDAADHLRQGLDLQRYQGNPHFFIEGSLALARVQQAQNDSQAAWQTLETAERIFQKTNHPQQSLILAARALLQLRQGQLDDSVRWSVTSGLSVDDTLVPAREFEYRVLARILIRQGEHASALRLLERLRADAEAQERLGSVIELLVLQSLAYQAKGDKARASSTLNRALALAEPEGFIRVFVDEGTRMMALLSRTLESFQQGSALAPSGISLSYLNALLVASGAVRTADASLSEPLSQRELEVLRLLARGLPNKSIARELDLTPGTVKWYINGLFSKLEVSSRTQAMARASSLGLV